MSKAHRQEVLDDNMYDSNWEKWVGIGRSHSIILIVAYYCLQWPLFVKNINKQRLLLKL